MAAAVLSSPFWVPDLDRRPSGAAEVAAAAAAAEAGSSVWSTFGAAGVRGLLVASAFGASRIMAETSRPPFSVGRASVSTFSVPLKDWTVARKPLNSRSGRFAGKCSLPGNEEERLQ